jgi:UrcA family protein
MTIKTAAILAAAIGALGLTAPAYAKSTRYNATVQHVGYGDLDLLSADGQAELQRRVDKATSRACMFEQDGALRQSRDYAQCYRETRRQVAVQVAETISNRPLLGG